MFLGGIDDGVAYGVRPLSESDLYEFKISLFNNGNPEEFLLFVCDFNMTIPASGTLDTSTKVKYLCMIFHVYVLRHFDSLSAGVESTNPLTLEAIVLELGAYFFPVNSLLQKKRTMRHGIRKPFRLKLRRYAARLIDINKYLALFPRWKLTDKIGMRDIKEIL